jgi:hypothetical protein
MYFSKALDYVNFRRRINIFFAFALQNHGRKHAHDSKFIIMLIVINIMLVPRDLPQVSTTTTDTNFKLYDSCMPYMGMQQKQNILNVRLQATTVVNLE